jgi:hypothetical protein
LKAGIIVDRNGMTHLRWAPVEIPRPPPPKESLIMSRLAIPATIEASPAAAQPLLEAVKKQLGAR